jgi:hypothetical protein
MKNQNLFVLILLLASCSFGLGGVTVEPFFVSKVSPSGNYSTKQFSLLWAAFCEQYRIGPKGTFIQYPFAKTTVESPGMYGRLFATPLAPDSGAHIAGVNNEYSYQQSAILTENDAKQYVMRGMTRLVTLRVGNESTTKWPGAYEYKLVNAPKPIQLLDQDVRSNPQTVVSDNFYRFRYGSGFIYFADPASIKQGVVELRVSILRYDGDSDFLIEVGKIQDTKDNQNNFIEALKAGSCFRVYIFNQSACYNCGGLGRIAPRAGAARTSTSTRGASSALSLPSASTAGLSGSNAIDDKCKCCGGTGRIALGKIYALTWDSFDPTLFNSQGNNPSR